MKAKTNVIIRASAKCEDCEWTWTVHPQFTPISNPMDRLRVMIIFHIKETGHTISLDTLTRRSYVPTDGFGIKANPIQD